MAQIEEHEAAPSQQRPPIQIDDSKIVANYANFCRVTGTPEELMATAGTVKDLTVTVMDWKGGVRAGSAAAVTGAPLGARMSVKL